MLIQSHLNEIWILPALPDALPEGGISGVRARGGFELSFDWEGGKLNKLEVLSKSGRTCTLKYGEKIVEFDTQKGNKYTFDRDLKRL
jgi:alpha-L-fucosidase 2